MYKNEKILDGVKQIKCATDIFISRFIAELGSPDADDNVLYELKDKDVFIDTFNGSLKLVSIVSETKDNDTVQLYKFDNGVSFTYNELPVEAVLSIAYQIATENGINNMFDDLFEAFNMDK